jgi:hypothetical protein
MSQRLVPRKRWAPRWWPAGAVVAVLVALTLAGCAGTHPRADARSSPPSAAVRQTTTTTTRKPSLPAPESTTSTSASPVAAAVLVAYRAEWAAFDQALSTANAFDPSLPATMVDPALQLVQRNLVGDKADGIVGRGTVTVHPRVSQLTATSATVVDCAHSTSELVYASTGKPVPPVTPPENDGVTSTLVLTGGNWKVSEQTVTEGKCAPGS